ncbi:Ulp1 family isopeptidase [Paraburkholderia sp. BR14320]|uniref:Ulp1 family isopeptidase n=1 Tax=Paraburkholderia sp. BR14264 TaxID=3237001 RepID=UPI0034D036D0
MNFDWAHDLSAYNRYREEKGIDEVPPAASHPVDCQAGLPPAAEASGVLGQLANLQRGRTSDAGATMASPGIGGSMRLTSPAAPLVEREYHFQSARYDLPYVPESPHDSHAPYAARHSTAEATHTAPVDAAPRRSGGFMSSLKKALGFGGRRKDVSGATSSARHGNDTSMRRDSAFRADAPPPGHGRVQYWEDEAVDAQVTRQQGGLQADAQAPQARPARRPRDDIRRLAGSAMHAEETTLPSPDPARRKDLYEQDRPLIDRLQKGLEVGRTPRRTINDCAASLTYLSAWLKQVGKAPMEGRLFSKELKADAWMFIQLKGHSSAAAALEHLRESETSTLGIANIPRREMHRSREVPPADEAFIEAALGSHASTSKRAARAFSEWLSLNGHSALSVPAALHSEIMDRLLEDYKAGPGAQYLANVGPVLKHLRNFEATGTAGIKRRSAHFDLPEVDQRLILRFRTLGNAELQAHAQQQNESVVIDKEGHTKFDAYASAARTFSGWLQKQGRSSIAARLHDRTLMDDVERYAGTKGSTYRKAKAMLTRMASMFPPEAPVVTIARIGRERFVNALGWFAPNTSAADLATKFDADVDDLLVFLDARSETGLTPAGQALVNTFEGRLRQAAEANVDLRRQRMAMAAQGMGQTPMPSPLVATPVGWSQISWDDAPTPQPGFGPAGSEPPGSSTIFGDLSSINSGAKYGGHGFDLNEPSDVTQPAETDSVYAGQGSLVSLSGYGAQESYSRSPLEVTGPSRPAPEIVDVDDYPSPEAAPESAAQRLARDPWLHDNNLLNYNQMVLHTIAQEMGPGGYQRLSQTLIVADSQQVTRLNEGTAEEQAEVLQHFTAPILLMPVNHANRHWSLLVVNRNSRQAFHYDSMIPPEHAHEATFTGPYEVARRVAHVLGVGAPMGMPMAQQRDEDSCGDHVLAGIETLARRILLDHQYPVQMDLSDIQPSRENIIATLTQYEQFAAQIHAAQASQQPGHMGARPRKKRG